MASALAILVAVAGLVRDGPYEQSSVVPFAIAVAFVLMLVCLLGLRAAHRHVRHRTLTAGFALTFVALAGASLFYLLLALSSVPVIEKLLEHEPSAATVTSLGMLLVMVVLPVGLLLLGLGLMRARVLPRWVATLPMALAFVFALGAAGGAVLERDEPVAGAVAVLLGGTWALLGVALVWTRPSPTTR